MTAALEVTNLTGGYSGIPIVHDVSLTVGAGELVALLGPNGAGKTTTLLGISGLLTGATGTVALEGAPLTGMSAAQRARAGLQHVPEDRSLFGSLTVLETLKLVSRSKETIQRVLRLFPALKALEKRRVAALSGGEQQMLALGRAMCLEPRVLLVDEMSLGLAPKIVASLFPVLRRIATEQACGVLLVEQHVHLALESVDRAYVMSNGEIVAEGSAESIRPRIGELTSTYLG